MLGLPAVVHYPWFGCLGGALGLQLFVVHPDLFLPVLSHCPGDVLLHIVPCAYLCASYAFEDSVVVNVAIEYHLAVDGTMRAGQLRALVFQYYGNPV